MSLELRHNTGKRIPPHESLRTLMWQTKDKNKAIKLTNKMVRVFNLMNNRPKVFGV